MRITRINLNLYKSFVEVYETKNLSMAAIKLGLTQPTITYNIKELEKQLKVRLFNSNSRGVEPTAYADELYPLVRTAFQALISAEDSVQDFTEQAGGAIRLNASPYFFLDVASNLIADFNKKYPNIQFEVYTLPKDNATSSLIKHETDIMIFTFTPQAEKNKSDHVETEVLFEMNNSIFASKEFAKTHNLGTKITKAQVEKLPMLALPKGFQARNELEKLGFSKKPVIEVSSTELIVDLVEKNVGISFGPDAFFAKNDKLMRFEITDVTLPKCFLAIRYNKNLANKAALAFIEGVKKAYNK